MATTQPTITMKQIAAELAEKNGMSKKDVEAIIEGVTGALVKNLKHGNRVRWKGVGIMQVKQTKARTGRNPATGETIQIPAKKKVAFRVSKELKEEVL
jgi:DNA-binding protein HU-beta